MSRIGRKPVVIPPNTEVQIEGFRVTVTGPQGTLTRTLPPSITLHQEDGSIVVSRRSEQRTDRALHGLTRSLLANMVEGVTQGYQKTLELVGVGYRVLQQGDDLTLTVGFSHPVEILQMAGSSVVAEGNNRIHVRSIDKEIVGEMAARIRAIRPPNRYTGKGIRYLGEKVRLKPGKTAGRKK